MEEQQQLFTAFVLEALKDRSEQLGYQWTERAELGRIKAGLSSENGRPTALLKNADDPDHLIRALLAAASHSAYEQRSLTAVGMTLGIEAHRRNMSLHLLLKELDLLNEVLLRGAEEVTRQHATGGTGYDGLEVGYCITEVTSRLRLAAVTGYTEAISDELRDRYRAIRHDLRNPLGTIKSAVALLTDETVPTDMRESGRVQEMVIRNTRSLDQLIDSVLGDTAAQLRAFETPEETNTQLARAQTPLSSREKSDNVTRPREAPDLESGTF
jgi:signal transduction histidine kinase